MLARWTRESRAGSPAVLEVRRLPGVGFTPGLLALLFLVRLEPAPFNPPHSRQPSISISTIPCSLLNQSIPPCYSLPCTPNPILGGLLFPLPAYPCFSPARRTHQPPSPSLTSISF